MTVRANQTNTAAINGRRQRNMITTCRKNCICSAATIGHLKRGKIMTISRKPKKLPPSPPSRPPINHYVPSRAMITAQTIITAIIRTITSARVHNKCVPNMERTAPGCCTYTGAKKKNTARSQTNFSPRGRRLTTATEFRVARNDRRLREQTEWKVNVERYNHASSIFHYFGERHE